MNILIEPNYDILLFIILISLAISGPIHMLLGLVGAEKVNYKRYDMGDAFDGFVKIVAVILILVWR